MTRHGYARLLRKPPTELALDLQMCPIGHIASHRSAGGNENCDTLEHWATNSQRANRNIGFNDVLAKRRGTDSFARSWHLPLARQTCGIYPLNAEAEDLHTTKRPLARPQTSPGNAPDTSVALSPPGSAPCAPARKHSPPCLWRQVVTDRRAVFGANPGYPKVRSATWVSKIACDAFREGLSSMAYVGCCRVPCMAHSRTRVARRCIQAC